MLRRVDEVPPGSRAVLAHCAEAGCAGARAPRWQGTLALELAARGARTVLARRAHHGPFMVQRAFYPEGGCCHLYLLHPPGGLVGGDALRLDAHFGEQSHTLLTTPGATRFYRSDGEEALQDSVLEVAAGARVEWLPQETIVFDGAMARVRTTVRLQGDARFMGWDMLCLGRRASGLPFQRGHCRQTSELWRDGQPRFVDRAWHRAGDTASTAAWGLGGFDVVGTLLATPATAAHRDEARAALGERVGTDGRAAVTLVRDVLVCRGLARGAEWLRRAFEDVWMRLRPLTMATAPLRPRIWAT